MSKREKRDRLILDRDLPQQEAKIGIKDNPVDLDEASQFTLEAELVRLSGLVKEKYGSRTDQEATNGEIKIRIKQAEEDKEKMSKRGVAAFNYLWSKRETWDG